MKNNNHGFTLMELLICLAILAKITFVGLVVWVIFHFIAKFW